MFLVHAAHQSRGLARSGTVRRGAVFWPDDSDLINWYLDTNANLVDALESAPPDVESFTFLPAPSPLAMWARRQAHETAIHRFDAENAAGIASEFDPTFAIDGIDELLAAFAPRADAFPFSHSVACSTDGGCRTEREATRQERAETWKRLLRPRLPLHRRSSRFSPGVRSYSPSRG
ncbi:MAG: maleylpyruvate isomerase family mycothiol-dependent enzyme [Acidobacteria bacterium]|nr:maleylpyruvate isomerase family mycothiol-dependent enzyme [Acidobacteriota bacterium]